MAPELVSPWSSAPDVPQEPYDPRGAANLILSEAGRVAIHISHLTLHKFLYFAHGLSLIERQCPFVSGYFEAWRYGPVHPVVYSAFREAGSGPIEFVAQGRDALTGQQRDLPEIENPAARLLIQRVITGYGRLSPGRIVEIAHAKDGPWDFVVKKSQIPLVYGMRIPDDVILSRFRQHHIVPVGDKPRMGEPSEDTPPA